MRADLLIDCQYPLEMKLNCQSMKLGKFQFRLEQKVAQRWACQRNKTFAEWMATNFQFVRFTVTIDRAARSKINRRDWQKAKPSPCRPCSFCDLDCNRMRTDRITNFFLSLHFRKKNSQESRWSLRYWMLCAASSSFSHYLVNWFFSRFCWPFSLLWASFPLQVTRLTSTFIIH